MMTGNAAFSPLGVQGLQEWGLHKSGHFRTRQAQRKITDDEIALTLKCGRRFYEGPDRVFFMRRRDIPAYVPAERAKRLDGVTVIVSADGTLETAYRNPEYLRELKKRRA